MFIVVSVFFGIVSMISYALANVYSQPLAKKLGAAQLLFLRGIAVTSILAILALASLQDFNRFKEILITFGLGIAGYLPVLAFTHGIKISRVSIMAPIAGTAPLITVMLSFFIFNTQIHLLQWLAIIIVIGANVAISVDLKNWRNSNILQLSSGVPFAIIASLGWGCFYFLLVYSTRWLGPWLSACIAEAGVTFAAGIHIIISTKKVSFKKVVSKSIFFNSVLLCLGTVAYTLGVLYFNIGIIAALSNSVTIPSVILAAHLYHEHLTQKEKLAATVMILGILTITIF